MYYALDDEWHYINRIDSIKPGLFITGIDGAKRTLELTQKGVTHVISILSPQQPCIINPKFQHTRFDSWDSPDVDIVKVAKQAHLIIQCALKDNGVVLVHCAAGCSRSVSVVIYHLMQIDPSLTVSSALSLIRQHRPIADPNYGFIQQLEAVPRDFTR